MIFVIDAQSARYGVSVEAATILECGVGREDRELALQLSLHRIIVLLADFATALAFECVLNLRANVLHPATLGSLVEKLGGADLHPSASYTL